MDKKGKKSWIVRALALLLIIPLSAALLFAVLMYAVPALETVDASPVEGSADWMGRLPDSMPLSEVVLPCTHDSATQYVQLAFFAKCQDLSVGEQLEAGFRCLDIRLGADGDRLKLMHGFTSCTEGGWPWSRTLYLDSVLDECVSFLKAHPNETVVFSVKMEHGDETVTRFQELLGSYIQRDADMWLLTSKVPTVGEARGKLVLLRRFPDEAGLGADSGLSFMWFSQSGHGDVSLNTVSSENGSFTLWVQDRYEYGLEDKWSAFLAGMESAKPGGDAIALNFLSTKGVSKYGHPYKYASKLDPRLLEIPAGSLSGWIFVDFASPKLAEKIYSANFER